MKSKNTTFNIPAVCYMVTAILGVISYILLYSKYPSASILTFQLFFLFLFGSIVADKVVNGKAYHDIVAICFLVTALLGIAFCVLFYIKFPEMQRVIPFSLLVFSLFCLIVSFGIKKRNALARYGAILIGICYILPLFFYLNYCRYVFGLPNSEGKAFLGFAFFLFSIVAVPICILLAGFGIRIIIYFSKSKAKELFNNKMATTLSEQSL
jgi:hypothetical protein